MCGACGLPFSFDPGFADDGVCGACARERPPYDRARAVMVYLVQRGDAERCAIARDIDPAYGDALDVALDAGVETLCYGCRLSVDGIDVTGPIEFNG